MLLHGKKICGILIEQRNTGRVDSPLATAVGIGLNVGQSAEFFAQANLPLGGSLASLAGKSWKPGIVAERLIERMDQAYDRLLQGDADALEAIWQDRLGLIGEAGSLETAAAASGRAAAGGDVGRV